MQRRTRGVGIPVNPERIREARLAAGLTLAELGGGEVSRTFIHQLEKGVSRPSADVLELISRKTGKPVRYFTAVGSDERVGRQMLAADLIRLAARVRRVGETTRLDTVKRQSLKLLEASLRYGAVLARNI